MIRPTTTVTRERFREVVEQASRNNHWRQSECVNLIPSEMTASPLVRFLEICDVAGRYAEHRTVGDREVSYYQGTDFIIQGVEESLRSQMAEFLKCSPSQIELRAISGQMANEAVFKAMVRNVNRASGEGNVAARCRMASVLVNHIGKGGHLSSQPFGALFNYVEVDLNSGRERVFEFPVDDENPYRIDVERACELIDRAKPDLIVFGKSMVLEPEPVGELARRVREAGLSTVILYDMAHTLGLYGRFQAPLVEGAHLLTGSTHKTFFGTQRGIVATAFQPDEPRWGLWRDLKNRIFPGSVSNHHLGSLLGLLGAAIEMNAFKDDYQGKVV